MISKAKAQRNLQVAAGKQAGYAAAVYNIFDMLDEGHSLDDVKAEAAAAMERIDCAYIEARYAVDQAANDADTRAWDRKVACAKASVARDAANKEIGK